MKLKTNMIAFALATGVVFASRADEPQNLQSYKVNTDRSEVEWRAEKVTGEHTGKIRIAEGSLVMSDGQLSGGSFTVDMSTITCTDLIDEGMNQKLVSHLKSDDFFGVEKHPYAELVLTDIKNVAGDRYEVHGNITIKGITEEIVFPAKITAGEDGINAGADLVLDRSKFNVRYRSGSFFDNLGDKLIYDEFDLKISLIAEESSGI